MNAERKRSRIFLFAPLRLSQWKALDTEKISLFFFFLVFPRRLEELGERERRKSEALGPISHLTRRHVEFCVSTFRCLESPNRRKRKKKFSLVVGETKNSQNRKKVEPIARVNSFKFFVSFHHDGGAQREQFAMRAASREAN